jgi:O-antigen/teichoic acid export membrane protein
VQAALLPKLARLLGAGAHADFRSGLRKLLLVVVGIGLLGVVGGFTLGPLAGEILFDKSIDRADLALLCAGSGAFILALTLAQALIALVDHARATLSWSIGIAIGAIALGIQSALDVELFLRIELSFLAASLGSALIMATFLFRRLQQGVPEESGERLVEAIEHEPLEI